MEKERQSPRKRAFRKREILAIFFLHLFLGKIICEPFHSLLIFFPAHAALFYKSGKLHFLPFLYFVCSKNNILTISGSGDL